MQLKYNLCCVWTIRQILWRVEVFLTNSELRKIGFKKYGTNVLISSKASIYGAELISIGNNVRIDDFCVLSGKNSFGNNIHIGAGSMIYSSSEKNDNISVEFNDFSGVSSRCAIYAISDDYSGLTMSNPMVPDKYKGVIKKNVNIGKHCIVGTGSTILPGANLDEGVVVGAMSLVAHPTKPWKIYFGVPARAVQERKKDLLDLEREFIKDKDSKWGK